MENTLYYGDNLHILRDYIPSESIDLIYLDPPFKSKADYNILFKEPTGEQSEAQIIAFEDTWHWTPESQRIFEDLPKYAHSQVVITMNSFRRSIGINDMMAYLTMMCIRLIELYRVLKNTGSIYLHCDPTASHYLKILMDTIFGVKNFRNEIIWHYRRWTNNQSQFQRMHDVILFYTKSDYYYYKPLEIEFSDSQKKKYKRGYDTNVIHAKKKIYRQIIIYDEDKVKKAKIDLSKFDNVVKRDKPNVSSSDVIIMPVINSQARERLGYPTQKPEALLEILINSSSQKGDVILDPFCGCGTTVAMAEKLKRNWIGIDITHLAVNLMKFRLKNMFGLEPKKTTA